MKSIGDILREARTDFGRSQDDVAKNAGIEKTYLSRLENGHAQPTVEMLIRISRAMGCTVSALMEKFEKDRC